MLRLQAKQAEADAKQEAPADPIIFSARNRRCGYSWLALGSRLPYRMGGESVKRTCLTQVATTKNALYPGCVGMRPSRRQTPRDKLFARSATASPASAWPACNEALLGH